MSQPLLINDLSKVLIQDNCTLESCLKGLSAGGYQISLVQRSDGRMAGIVTDSDVRKALLRGVGLSDSIHLVLNDKPKVIRQSSLPATDISSLMKSFNVFHLPILDDSNNFVGLYITPELAPKNTLSETVVIMAGGKGKRLMPLTANTPKPMLIVKGKPMLEHILLQLKQDGFKNIVISVIIYLNLSQVILKMVKILV